MTKYVRFFAYAWIIIIGVLMITPDGIQCIACGSVLTAVLGIISILVGIAGFALDRRGKSIVG